MSLIKKIGTKSTTDTSSVVAQRVEAAARADRFAGRSALKAPTGGFLSAERQAAFDSALADLSARGVTVRGYQQAAVETLAECGRGVLGYAPGLGKTLIALTTWEVLQRSGATGSLLVVCPPHLRINWTEEVTKWFPGRTVSEVVGTKAADLSDVFTGTDVVVVNDSVISRRLDDLLAVISAGLVGGIAFDESQRFKTDRGRSQRTDAAATLLAAVHAANRDALCVSATGTLVANGRPEDVYFPLALGGSPEVLRRIDGAADWSAERGPVGWYRFRNTWAASLIEQHPGGQHKVYGGCVDPVRLHEQITSANYLHVDRYEVTDLDPVVWAPQTDDVGPTALSEYWTIARDVVAWVRRKKGAPAAERTAKAAALAALNYLREHSGLARAASTAEVVEGLLAQDEQVVVFVEHTSVLLAVEAALLNKGVRSVIISGGQSAAQKREAQRRYVEGEVDVLIANTAAASTGLNLDSPRSRTVLFHQLPWSSSQLVQAAGRVERLTQTRTCVAVVPLAVDGSGRLTIDHHIWNVLNVKLRTSDLITTGGASDTLDRVVEDDEAIINGGVLDAVLTSLGWNTDGAEADIDLDALKAEVAAEAERVATA